MKITKARLKQIIKEELSNVLLEKDDVALAISDQLNNRRTRRMSRQQIHDELVPFLEEFYGVLPDTAASLIDKELMKRGMMRRR